MVKTTQSLDKTTDFLLNFVVIVTLVAGFATSLINSSTTLGASGLPLASVFFGSAGIVLLILMVKIVKDIIKSSK